MKKSDLKTGMVAERRDGSLAMVMLGHHKDNDCFASQIGGWTGLTNYNTDLITKDGVSDLDIMKVYEIPVYNTSSFFNGDLDFLGGALIWEREEKAQEVTMADIEAKFGCKVKIIKED